MLIKKILLIKIKVFCVIIFFVAISVFSSTGQLNGEKNAITDSSSPFKNRCDYGGSVVTNIDGF